MSERSPSRRAGLTKRFRHQVAVDALDLRRAAGGGLRLPRTQRLGQDHDHPDAARAWSSPTAGTVAAARAADAGQVAPHVLPRVGALVEGPAFHPYLSGRANLARLDAADRDHGPPHRASANRRGPGPGGPAGGGDQALPRLLARHASAARHRQRPAASPRPAGPRRARRTGSTRRAPARSAPWSGRSPTSGTHRAGLEPPAVRGRADVHPRRRHARRPARRPGHQSPRLRGGRERRGRPSRPTSPSEAARIMRELGTAATSRSRRRLGGRGRLGAIAPEKVVAALRAPGRAGDRVPGRVARPSRTCSCP